MPPSPLPDSSTAKNQPWPGYWFDQNDQEEWLQHLREEGFVVLKSVAAEDQVRAVKDLFWRDIEASAKISRGHPEGWGKWCLPDHGLMANYAQTAGAWQVRGLSAVKQAFAAIWDDEDLIVSMDAVIMWRPWPKADDATRLKAKAASLRSGIPLPSIPQTEGLHLDQNPFTKPHLDCVQGMMPLLVVDGTTGGLEVVPRSHTDAAKAELKQRYGHMANRGDWCPLFGGDPLEEQAILLEAEAGDLVLWDSRTVHGGKTGQGQEPPFVDLARMSVTVAMTPRALASAKVLANRLKGFLAGQSFNHCPHEAGISSGTIHAKRSQTFADFELSDAQRSLL